MKRHRFDLKSEFATAIQNSRAQSAEMVLAPGGHTGGPDNIHEGSDQWLFVVSGEGKAIVDGTEVELLANTMLLIEAGEPHEIRNTGSVPLATVNLYVPPEY